MTQSFLDDLSLDQLNHMASLIVGLKEAGYLMQEQGFEPRFDLSSAPCALMTVWPSAPQATISDTFAPEQTAAENFSLAGAAKVAGGEGEQAAPPFPPDPIIDAAIDAAFAHVLPGYDLVEDDALEPDTLPVVTGLSGWLQPVAPLDSVRPLPDSLPPLREPPAPDVLAAPVAHAVAPVETTVAPPGTGKPPAWTEDEDHRLIDIIARAVHGDGISRWKAAVAAAAVLGRPVEGTKFRMNTKLADRIDARIAELAGEDQSHSAPAVPAQGAPVVAEGGGGSPDPLAPAAAPANAPNLADHIAALPRKNGWTLKRDADLMNLAVKGWKHDEIAVEFGVAAGDVKARFDLLTGYDRETKTRAYPRDAVSLILDGMMARATTPHAAE